METINAAASSAVARLVAGVPRDLQVVAALPQAVYLADDAPPDPTEPPALCLVGPRAVRVPSALVLRGEPPGWSRVPVGTVATVGAGRVDLPGLSIQVTRWWRTPRPVLPTARVHPAQLAALAPPPLDPDLAGPVAALTSALASPAALDGLGAAVGQLLGRGPGLTPLGDDVLAGALVALHGLRAGGTARRLGQLVLAAAPAATTVVSGALLWHAARGECVPELGALIEALGADRRTAVAAARTTALRIGHTSGVGLLHGVAAALHAVGAADAPRRNAS